MAEKMPFNEAHHREALEKATAVIVALGYRGGGVFKKPSFKKFQGTLGSRQMRFSFDWEASHENCPRLGYARPLKKCASF